MPNPPVPDPNVNRAREDMITAGVYLMHGPPMTDDVNTAVSRLIGYTQQLLDVLAVLPYVRHEKYCPYKQPVGFQKCTCGLLARLTPVLTHLFPEGAWADLTTPTPWEIHPPSKPYNPPWLDRSN